MDHKSLGRDDIPEFVFSFCLIKSVAANIEARELRLPSGKFEVNFPKYYDRHNELVNRHGNVRVTDDHGYVPSVKVATWFFQIMS